MVAVAAQTDRAARRRVDVCAPSHVAVAEHMLLAGKRKTAPVGKTVGGVNAATASNSNAQQPNSPKQC
eukprot:11033268-Lingulodinium_polyedra.AAC.1